MPDTPGGPPASAPARLIYKPETARIRAAASGMRNGMPESKPYVYGQAAKAREQRAALFLARVRAQLGIEAGENEQVGACDEV